MSNLTFNRPDETAPQGSRPLFGSSVQAGFPSPAEDYIESTLDLNRHLVKNPASTFFVRVAGNSMKDAAIHPGDILIVDRSLTPLSGKIVIAVIDGELTVKRLLVKENGALLRAESPQYDDISIEPEAEFEVWGVVTHIIHQAF
ncbi:MAG: translesion error-prone DNA polymerase V autoproteolytic subunit [Spirochaetes bacterium]|jgi:DNA polymerase V|nr:translesion error-prone DNA polymerase V autoproteolytic subunit [Spirochaetota bacterium]